MVKNVNKGICQSRLQNNEPCYFVNWYENRQNNYKYFSIVSSMYQLYDRLTKTNNKN